MAFKKPSVKKTIFDLERMAFYIRAEKKFGKTTLFRDIVLAEYGNPNKGVLAGVGGELGYRLIQDLNTTQLESWQDFLDLKDYLLSEEGKEIKLVAFDTVEEVIAIAEKEICKRYEMETKKVCPSIKAAFGGYGAGQKMVRNLLSEYMQEIRKAGKGIVYIGHTVYKTIPNKCSDDSIQYKQLTGTLTSDYESFFSDIPDMVITGVVHRDIEGEEVINSERRLYFKGTAFVDAGARGDGFEALPEYIVLDKNNGELFVKTIKSVMDASAKSSGNIDLEEYKEQSRKDLEEADIEHLASIKYEQMLDKVEDIVKNNYSDIEFKSFITDILKRGETKKIKDLSKDLKLEILKEADEKGFI